MNPHPPSAIIAAVGALVTIAVITGAVGPGIPIADNADPADHETNWTHPRGDVLQSINTTTDPEYDQQTISYTLAGNITGNVRIHVINETTGRTTMINPVTNTTGRTVWADHRVRIIQVTEHDRRVLRTGDVRENGVKWTPTTVLADIPDRDADAAAGNITVQFTNLSDDHVADYRVTATGAPEHGVVVAEYWANPRQHSPWLFQAGAVPQDFHLFRDATIRVYYSAGDERRLLARLDPYADENHGDSDAP